MLACQDKCYLYCDVTACSYSCTPVLLGFYEFYDVSLYGVGITRRGNACALTRPLASIAMFDQCGKAALLHLP
jgi:hypothetical protein